MLVLSAALLSAFAPSPLRRDRPLPPQGIDAPRISQKDFKKLISTGSVVIVDTRGPDAYTRGHIPGALLLPLEGRMSWPEASETVVATLLKTKKIVVAYCA
jgi:rhodanese-related sulfurtransferase